LTVSNEWAGREDFFGDEIMPAVDDPREAAVRVKAYTADITLVNYLYERDMQAQRDVVTGGHTYRHRAERVLKALEGE
jgi:hypothetical protein